MGIYLFFIVGVIGVIALYDLRRNKSIYYFATLIMCLFAGLRYGVGTDYWTYKKMLSAAKMTQLAEYEGDIGFLIISKIISHFTDNTRVHFFVISSFIVILFMLYIYKYSKVKWLSVLIYLGLGSYFVAFNIMRQFIAVAICIYAYKYIINDSKKYYIFIVLASTFHMTALVMIPVKILVTFKWSKITYMILSGIGIFIYLNMNYVLSFFEESNRISGYTDSYYTNQGSNPMTFIIILLIFIFCAFFKNNYEDKNEREKFIKILFLGVIFAFCGMRGLIFNRIAEYFMASAIILIPNIIINFKSKERRMLMYLVSICLMIYVSFLLMNQGNLVPYRIN
jgi:transmembrane protein EpsG